MTYSGTSSVITAIPITPKQIERFWTKVSVRSDDECWLWTASLTPSGYGRVGIFGQTFYAHRVSDYIANGPPPPGIYICHTCDNPTCVNPRHLYRGTQKQNVRDREERGRGNRPRSPEVAKRNKRIAEKYKNGATLQELSDTFGLCISVCRRAVLKNGVPMRSTGRRKRVTS